MKQKQALDIMKAGRNVYLTGPAGSGKTYVLRQYIEYLKERGVTAGLTASTGIAATHLGGVTIHSWSGMGIKDNLTAMNIEALTEKEYLWRRYDKTKVLIIDEVSMMSKNMFDSLERLCRAMKRDERPFGGMQIILSGDFFQLPPITKNNEKAEFIISSDAWKGADIRVCYLDGQFRQNDGTLEAILAEIRGGEVSDETRELLHQHSMDNDVDEITPTRLFTHNKDVDVLNEEELKKLPGEVHEYYMDSKGKATLVESLKKGLLSPEILRLKKDAVVMFVKNNFEEGYVNGTLGTVEEFRGDVPIVRTFGGSYIEVTEADWSIEEDGKVLAKVTQLPLRLAWAITVHKSQGMSLDAAHVDLSNSFVPGQGYVALSRLRTLRGLVLKGMNEIAFMVHPEVLKFDSHLKKESEKWEIVISRFDEKAMTDMHNVFVLESGGTLDKVKMKENKKKKSSEVSVKISTYEKTKELLLEGKTIEEIMEDRGVVFGTVVSHIEKLLEKGEKIDIKKIKPEAKDLKIIKKAFKEVGDTKLTPLFEKLDGKYTYEQIRIARLFF